ncbi:MAG: hypothetical protein E7505_10415 [Ruminococcus sp.]|nr:hypothetical protein [Ruminococcus sp.]
MSDKIKNILEAPEVPDEFRPENIHLLLEEKRGRKKRIVRTLGGAAAAVACMAVAAGLASGGNRFLEETTSTDQMVNDIDFTASDRMEAEDITDETDFAESGSDYITISGYDALFGVIKKSDTVKEPDKNDSKETAPEAPEAVAKDDSKENLFDDTTTSNGITYTIKGNVLTAEDYEDNGEKKVLMTADICELSGTEKESLIKTNYLFFAGDMLYIVSDFSVDGSFITGILMLDVSGSSFELKGRSFLDGKFFTKISTTYDDTVFIVTEYLLGPVPLKTTESDTQSYIPCMGSDINDMKPLPVDSIYMQSALGGEECGIKYIVAAKLSDTDNAALSDAVTDVPMTAASAALPSDDKESFLNRTTGFIDKVFYSE